MEAWKNERPTQSVKIGPAAVISAILIGLEVVNAKYCKALYVVVLKNPVAANTTHALRAKGQSSLRRRHTKGNKTKTATTHRKKFKVLAHIRGGTTKNNRVKGRIETDHF